MRRATIVTARSGARSLLISRGSTRTGMGRMASANTSPPAREWSRSGRPRGSDLVSDLDAARTSARDAVRRETAPLLAQRIRSGLCFLLIALAPFASYELSRASHELLSFAV